MKVSFNAKIDKIVHAINERINEVYERLNSKFDEKHNNTEELSAINKILEAKVNFYFY